MTDRRVHPSLLRGTAFTSHATARHCSGSRGRYRIRFPSPNRTCVGVSPAAFSSRCRWRSTRRPRCRKASDAPPLAKGTKSRGHSVRPIRMSPRRVESSRWRRRCLARDRPQQKHLPLAGIEIVNGFARGMLGASVVGRVASAAHDDDGALLGHRPHGCSTRVGARGSPARSVLAVGRAAACSATVLISRATDQDEGRPNNGSVPPGNRSASSCAHGGSPSGQGSVGSASKLRLSTLVHANRQRRQLLMVAKP